MSAGSAIVTRHEPSSAATMWVPVGAVLFMVALAGSAIVVPQLRLLHVLQALIYVAVAIFGRGGSTLAFGAAITMAAFWKALQLFITHNMEKGLVLFWLFLRSGHARQLDTMIVPLGGVAHFILIAACTCAFLEQEKGRKKWWKLLAGGVIVMAYFALIVALALPR